MSTAMGFAILFVCGIAVGYSLRVIINGAKRFHESSRPLTSKNLFPGWPRCVCCNRVFGHDKYDRETCMCSDCLDLAKARE